MSRNDRWRREAQTTASNANAHRTRISLPGPSREVDRPITTFVDRVSNDNRRLYREEVPVLPPSPVKRQKLAQHVAASAALSTTTPAHTSDDSLSAERYQISGFDDDPFASDGLDPPLLLGPRDRSNLLSLRWQREKVDTYLSEFIRLDGRGKANIDWCPGCFGPNPAFRCRDCHGGAVYCKGCIVARHVRTRFIVFINGCQTDFLRRYRWLNWVFESSWAIPQANVVLARTRE
ncbi:hypothetical protein B0H13DRAFT_2387657 [Mycena leptocephala]|nr:hypothetical protein B0H13DRAFT_2387657 [Mycena leptocephala]